jgi:hypothetical protein
VEDHFYFDLTLCIFGFLGRLLVDGKAFLLHTSL